MKAPAFPDNEAERQKEVDKYQLLDTLPEESYDTITALMAYICEVPISLVSIIDRDRNFLKSHHGIPFNEDPRDRSFCGHAIVADVDIMIVPDTTADERFRDNPLVSEMGVRFYAGAPLINPNGYKLGTLCVFDMKPKDLNQHQVQALMNMSKQVMLIMEERFKNIKLKQVQNELLQRN
jgi:GAF domain-containing protein